MRRLDFVLAILVVLTAGATETGAQDGLWFANYQAPSAGITKYAFDGTVIKDVPIPGSICYSGAVDYAQNVWITTSSSVLYKIDSTGNILLSVSTGAGPQGVAVDAVDNVYVVSRSAMTVTKYDSGGKAVQTGQTPRACLSCIVDTKGNVIVPCFDLVQTGIPFEIYKYDNNLQNRITFTFTPTNTSRYAMSGIACDTADDLYVANQARSTVMKINAFGTVAWETPIPAYARGVAADAVGQVWAAGHAGRAVFKLRASDGTLLSTFNTPNSSPLCGVLVDANSDVWSLGNVRPIINKWDRRSGTNLVQATQRTGSTVATGDTSGYHSAVFLNGARDFDGDGASNLVEARAGTSYLDIFSTPKKPTPILSGTLTGATTLYVGVRHAASAGMNYTVGFSLGTSPGIPVPGAGTIPLNLDNLLILSLQFGPPLFNDMFGVLDALGDGLAHVRVPSGLPSNLAMYTAFVTFDFKGIHVISNPAKLLTQ